MADPFLQGGFVGAVVDGQVQVDFGDGQAAHHPVQVEHFQVVVGQGVAAAGHKGVVDGVAGEVFVVFFGQGPLGGQVGFAFGLDGLFVGLDDAGLVALGQHTADGRVAEDRGAPHKEQQGGGKGRDGAGTHGGRVLSRQRAGAAAPAFCGLCGLCG